MENGFEENGLIYSDETKKVVVGVAESLENATELVVPEGVETIEAGAFRQLEDLHKLTLPSTLKKVGCNYLSDSLSVEIIAPVYESLTFYGPGDFESYGKLPVKKAFLKADDNSIGDSAFMDWTTLEEVVVKGNLESIYHYAFADCSNLESVRFDGSVGLICNSAFAGCDSLEDINISDETVVEDGAFDGENEWRNGLGGRVDLDLSSGFFWDVDGLSVWSPDFISVEGVAPNTTAKRELYESCSWRKTDDNRYIGTSLQNGNSILLSEEIYNDIERCSKIRKTFEYKVLPFSMLKGKLLPQGIRLIEEFGKEGYELVTSATLNSKGSGPQGIQDNDYNGVLIFKREVFE